MIKSSSGKFGSKTAHNDVTGASIKTGFGDKSKDNKAYESGWDAIWGKKEAEKPSYLGKITYAVVGELSDCASAQDGDCSHPSCPQLRDKEPATSGRSCPLYDWDRDHD